MRRLVLCAFLLLVSPATRAQELPVFSASVEMVHLDVAVTRKGQPIRHLEARHFEVRDNGALQDIEVVAQEEKPVHAVLALDNSSSLAGERLERLKVAAHALLEILGPKDAVSLLTFSSRLELRALPGAPRDAVHAAIDATEAQLNTSLYDAAFAALTLAEPALGRPIVLVFTDGQDVGSWLRPEQVLRAAQSADLVSHAIIGGPAGGDSTFLEDLTATTGGEVWKVEHLELEEAFLQALGEFRSRYTLQYAAQGEPVERWHEIDVRVRIPGVKVRVREGYLRRGNLP